MSNTRQGGDASRKDRSLDLSASAAREATPPQRKTSPRLKTFDYVGGYRYHLVLLTRDRQPIFESDAWARTAIELLAKAGTPTGFEVLAYCVMPDHIHMLVEGDSSRDADLTKFAHRYKQALGFRFKQATGQQLWHRSYYDHVLRPEEPLEAHVAYILGNPVRAGLVETVDRWPYSGPEHMLPVAALEDRSKDLSLRVSAISRTLEDAFEGIMS